MAAGSSAANVAALFLGGVRAGPLRLASRAIRRFSQLGLARDYRCNKLQRKSFSRFHESAQCHNASARHFIILFI